MSSAKSTSGLRTRTGCWTCRARHLKCDEQRPTCQRCLRGRRSCSYDTRLRWEDDAQSRGICHGRAGVWSKDSSPSDAAIQSPELPAYLVSHENVMTADYLPAHMNEANARLSLRNPAMVPCGYQYSDDESLLFQYYQTVICDTSALINTREQNHCKFHILPLAFEHKAVYHAILMVAAKGRRQRTDQYETLSLEYQQSSLNRLMRILNQIRIGHAENYWDEVLVLVVLLCVCDIWDGSRPAWVKHFICYRDMALLKTTTHSLMAGRTRPMYRWFNKFFIYHIVMCKTAFNIDHEVGESAYITSTPLPDEPPSSQQTQGRHRNYNYHDSWTSSETLSLSMSLDELDYIDPYQGFSDALLLLINDIADLKYQFISAILDDDIFKDQNLMEEIIQACVHKYNRLKATLESIEQHLPPTVLEYGTVDDSQRQAISKVLVATSKAYKYASLILLSETVGLLAKYYTSFTGAVRDYQEIFDGYNPQFNELHAIEIIQLVQEVVNFTDIGLTTSWPLWPLFIAGCVVNDKWYRALVEDSFEMVMRRTPFGGFLVARQIIEKVWQQKDTESDLGFQAEGRTEDSRYNIPTSLMFSWEQVIQEFGLKVSLA